MTSTDLENRFNTLYEATSRQTAGYLMARCRRAADLSDLLQETYLEVFRALSRTPEDELRSGPALVRQLAKQTLYKYYRTLDRQDEIPLVHTAGADDESTVDLSDLRQAEAALGEQPDDLIHDKLIMEEIQRTIRTAPASDRRIVEMRYGLDLTLREIAEILEIPESTVKSRLYRFLARVREAHQDIAEGG